MYWFDGYRHSKLALYKPWGRSGGPSLMYSMGGGVLSPLFKIRLGEKKHCYDIRSNNSKFGKSLNKT